MRWILLSGLMLAMHPVPACADEDPKAEYEERLAKLDLAAGPEGHKNLAS